jgi:hypothetical protein
MNSLRNAAIAMVCLGAVLASETLGEAQSTAAKPLIVGTKQQFSPVKRWERRNPLRRSR